MTALTQLRYSEPGVDVVSVPPSQTWRVVLPEVDPPPPDELPPQAARASAQVRPSAAATPRLTGPDRRLCFPYRIENPLRNFKTQRLSPPAAAQACVARQRPRPMCR